MSARNGAAETFEGGVRVYRPTASYKYWRVVVPAKPGGRGRTSRTAKTRAAALAIAREHSHLLARGEDVSKLDTPLEQVAEAWSDPARHEHWQSTTTARQNVSRMRQHILPHLQGLTGRDLDIDVGVRILHDMRAAGYSANSIKGARNTYSGFVTWAQERGYVPIQPERRLIPQIPRSVDRSPRDRHAHPPGGSRVASGARFGPDQIIEPQALGDLANAMGEQAGWRWRVLVLIGAASGLRPAELMALSADQVNLSERTILVDRQAPRGKGAPPRRPKHYKARTTVYASWVHDELAKIVKLARDEQAAGTNPQALLATNPTNGDPITPGSFRHHWARATAALEDRWPRFAWIPGAHGRYQLWRPHTLRHFFATYCLYPEPDGLGMPVNKVAEWLGHSSPTVTLENYLGELPGFTTRFQEASSRRPQGL